MMFLCPVSFFSVCGYCMETSLFKVGGACMGWLFCKNQTSQVNQEMNEGSTSFVNVLYFLANMKVRKKNRFISLVNNVLHLFVANKIAVHYDPASPVFQSKMAKSWRAPSQPVRLPAGYWARWLDSKCTDSDGAWAGIYVSWNYHWLRHNRFSWKCPKSKDLSMFDVITISYMIKSLMRTTKVPEVEPF